MTVQILIVTMLPGASDAEADRVMRARMDAFESVQGLLQKFYFRSAGSRHRGGIFFFRSQEDVDAYRASELALAGGAAYQLVEAPTVERMDLVTTLRPEPWLARDTAGPLPSSS
jgi:hypothetical protein